MKVFLLFLLLSVSSLSFGADPIPSPSPNIFKFKVGDCFNYTDASTKRKVVYKVARIEDFDFGSFSFEGTLFVKKDNTHKLKDSLVTFHFELPINKQDKFDKVACPKELPQFKKP